ncbi:flagellar hook-associated protein 2 [Mesobacillus subterraneus]|uniref:Flagellar hook-associated protein 2 n=1 Tax=Mesobacillus subterraneus TaxID=285983 RepID=A0A0D6Z5X3_9BACI|nr:flagellar hook-associated protein 2 [Mesobacillus subterraneus]KIY21159.1 hypothetical protein UB32_15285 [Mesobacillus subterraneus]
MASNMRIGGLASGMDIDQIVTDLMKAERIPLDKLTQKKQFLEWQRDDYREMNTSLLELDTQIFDGVFKQGSYAKKTISVSDPAALGVKNINSTVDFSGTVQVDTLAKAATMFSKASSTINTTDKLVAQGITAQTLTIKAIGKDGKLDQGVPIEITADDTIGTLIDKINKSTGVNAYFDEQKGTLSIIAKNTGDVAGTAEIELSPSGNAGDFWTAMNMHSDNIAASTDVSAGGPFGSVGANAALTYNGMPIERSSNNFTINGVEFILKQENTGNVNFSSSTDTDAILDTIVKFADKYNSVIEKVKNELEEKRYRDFQPLTTEQKDAMNEKDIERWEEKARSGTLKGDTILSGALNKMRMDLATAVEGVTGATQLAEIGITTSSNYLEGGKLVIDEDKLKAAITADPNGVYELFAKDGNSSATDGLARRLRDTIKDTMNNIETRAGKSYSVNNTFTLGRNLDSIDDQIVRFEDRLLQVEDRYWRQFTAMEKAIQRFNEQSMYMMQQFGGGM